MGLGIFIKMTLGVVRKEFGLHGWRAKHPTCGTTKGLCKARLPGPRAELSCFSPLSAVVRGLTWRYMESQNEKASFQGTEEGGGGRMEGRNKQEGLFPGIA